MKSLLALCALFAPIGKTCAFQTSVNIGKPNPFFRTTNAGNAVSVSSSTMMTTDLINDTTIEHNPMKSYQDSLVFGETHDQSTAAFPPPNSTAAKPAPPRSTVADSQQQQQVVHPISSMEELLSIMDGHRNQAKDQLTVIKYYADYCKLCQRAGIQMKRLVTEFPTVDFTKIEQKALTQPSADTLRALGVTKFPWIQIYRGGQCVASFSTGPSHMFMKRVRDTVTLCLERSPEAWQEFGNEFATPMEENAATRQRLRTELFS
jgi:Thioredoxin